MKRYLSPTFIGITLLTGVFLLAQRGWTQPPEPTRPVRTYALTIASNEVWTIVLETVTESDFKILMADPYRFKVVAVGDPYDVRVGFGIKKERQRLVIEIGQRYPGIYDCFVKTEIQEYWPVNSEWTPKPGSQETTETLVVIGRALSEKLRPYFRPIKRPGGTHVRTEQD